MSKFVKLRKGFDINLTGKAEKNVSDAPHPETFAIKPTDFQNITRPKVLVQEGDNVKAGTPLFYDKVLDEVQYCAPFSGEVVEVKRGEKRKLLEIRILADKSADYESFKQYTVSDLEKASREELTEQLTKSGVWPNIIQRPYGIVANPKDTPKAIFISAFDSAPLAPDYDVLLKGEEANLQAGITALNKFTSGVIHLNINGAAEVSQVFGQLKGVQVNKVTGPHPAGNVGVQIHHIDPIAKGEIVWTLTPDALAQIGRLMLQGKYDARKVVALVGSEVKAPQYYKTYVGASIKGLVADKLNSTHVRYISGNVLTGEAVAADGYLSYYHSQLTVIPEGDQYEFLGWLKPTGKKPSFSRALGLLSFLNPKKEFAVNTNTNGEERAFVATGVFERVVPMDIYPTHLLKAILAEDYDEMEALGIFEVVEEDFALCEFVDVSKHNVQEIVRQGLDLIQNS